MARCIRYAPTTPLDFIRQRLLYGHRLCSVHLTFCINLISVKGHPLIASASKWLETDKMLFYTRPLNIRWHSTFEIKFKSLKKNCIPIATSSRTKTTPSHKWTEHATNTLESIRLLWRIWSEWQCELSWFWREFTAPVTQMQHNFWCMRTNCWEKHMLITSWHLGRKK